MRPALLLFLLVAPVLGACAQTASSDGESMGETRRGGSESVQRIELEHMTAGDLSAVLEHRFRRELWVRVENRRNAVLIAGSEAAVAAAMEIAAELDVAQADEAEGTLKRLIDEI